MHDCCHANGAGIYIISPTHPRTYRYVLKKYTVMCALVCIQIVWLLFTEVPEKVILKPIQLKNEKETQNMELEPLTPDRVGRSTAEPKKVSEYRGG